MLNKEVFLDKLAGIMAWYVNFQFKVYDIDEQTREKTPSLQFQMWYRAFQNFNDDDFSDIVDGYLRENVYPPSSPTSLLEYAKKVLAEKNKANIDKVWRDLKDMILTHGFKSYQTLSPTSHDKITVNPLENALKKYGDDKLIEVFESMYSRFLNLNSSNEDFVRKDFFEAYEKLIANEIKNSVNQGKLTLGDNKLKLGEGENNL
jgi:virulence-associated protein VapD